MWPWFGSQATVYLGQDRAVACVKGRSRIDVAASGPLAVVDALESAWPEAIGRTRARVLLSGALARPFVLAPLDGVATRSEALAVARGAAAQTGVGRDCAPWLGRWRAGAACLAAAMDQALFDRLIEFAAHRRVRLLRVAPWWSDAADHAPARPRIIGLRDDDAFTVLGAVDGESPQAFSACPAPDDLRCAASVARLAMSIDGDDAPIARGRWRFGEPDDTRMPGAVLWQAAPTANLGAA